MSPLRVGFLYSLMRIEHMSSKCKKLRIKVLKLKQIEARNCYKQRSHRNSKAPPNPPILLIAASNIKKINYT